MQGALDAGLLIAGGGHAMAAGLTIRPSAIPELRAFLCDALSGEMAVAQEEDALEIDALVSPGGADRAMINDFQRLAPFGPGNPEPMFALADVRVERAFPMRGGHLRCDLTGVDGGKLRAVAWRAQDTPVGRRLAQSGASVHVAGRLKLDDWNGRQGVQMEIEDVADPNQISSPSRAM